RPPAHPVSPGHNPAEQERHNRKPAAKHEGARFREKAQTLPQQRQSRWAAGNASAPSDGAVPFRFNHLGGARSSQTSTPPSTNTQIISDAVSAVMVALIR